MKTNLDEKRESTMDPDMWPDESISCLPLCEAVYSDSRPAPTVGLQSAFSCSICQSPFSEITSFVRHVQQHTEEENYGSTLDTEEDDHNTTAYSKFLCAICNKSFPSDLSLINHVSRHSSDEMSEDINIQRKSFAHDKDHSIYFTCAICNKTFGSNKQLALHVKAHSTECDIKVSANVEMLDLSLKPNGINANKSDNNSCTKSEPTSLQASNGANISSRKTIKDDLSHQCLTCNKYFKNAKSLSSHQTIHSSDKKFSASQNNQDSLSKSEEDVKLEPDELTTFKCALCDKLFTNETALIAHVSTHATAKQHECVTCNKTFKCQSHLLRHQQVHESVRAFKCPACPSTFARKNHLSTHLRVHRGEQPFPCTSCDKTFTDGSTLAQHMRLHSKEEKSHRCDTCDRVFGRSDTLAKHKRSHSGAKPYQCQLCARLFPRQDSLQRHLKSHRGEKPHRCIVCDKAFTQKYDLTLHYRTHARNFTLPGGWGLDALTIPITQ